jgi:hypothetical protein
LAQLRQYSCANKKLTFTASTKKLRAKLSYEKGERKMLVKLTPALHRLKTTEGVYTLA